MKGKGQRKVRVAISGSDGVLYGDQIFGWNSVEVRLPFLGRPWSMSIPLVPASLACNQQTDRQNGGSGMKEGKNAMLRLKRVASGMTPRSAMEKKEKR